MPINKYVVQPGLYKKRRRGSREELLSGHIDRSWHFLCFAQFLIALGLLTFTFMSFLLFASLDKNAKLRQEAYNNMNSMFSWIDNASLYLQTLNEVRPATKTKQNRIPIPFKKTPNRAGRVGWSENNVPFRPSTENMCPVKNAKSDVQMLTTYIELPFENKLTNGVWNQGFEIKNDYEQMKKQKKLEVVVIPHSHCDPGWLLTFEQYFDEQVRNILNGMLKHLHHKKDMKFIYAEMSFFELWWSTLNDEQREETKKFVFIIEFNFNKQAFTAFLRSGQLEIVTGGWVMTDEANARSFSIVMELFEGHEFLRNQLEYKPQNHWSIDPFGLSPTLAKVIKSSGLSNMVINRVHYEIKKHLARTKQLEFRWRQLYMGERTETDIRTHLFPFNSYAIPQSCGPDPVSCCQFDFFKGCSQMEGPRPVTDKNIGERSALLNEQYHLKSQLYRMNTLLVPLGDDFRYSDTWDWESQYSNYKKLFNYMNNKPEWNINVRFGTLKDYFDLLDQRLAEEPPTSNYSSLPVLSGDFFTYADRDDYYWSGYFTSRPFYKHMDRTVQHYVRSADILHSLAMWKAKRERRAESALPHEFYDMDFKEPRRHRLFNKRQLKDSIKVMNGAAAYLLDIPTSKPPLKSNLEYYTNKLPKHLKVETGSVVVFHNSLAFERREIVCLRVASNRSRIQYGGSVNLRQQIQPNIQLINKTFVVEKDDYNLCFEATAKSLGTERYVLVEGTDSNHMVKIESIKYANEKETSVHLEFLHYGTKSISGAYLFLPDDSAKGFPPTSKAFIVMKGNVRETFMFEGPREGLVLQQLYFDYNSNYLDILTQVNVGATWNFELVMRFKALDFKGQDEQFYTDLNGYQMIRRMRFKKLPIQAHFYPMTTAAFIDSNGQRLTLLGRQSLGVASLEAGQVEVILDRRLMQDDFKGLGQGVTDNHETESHFRLFLEKHKKQDNSDDNRIGYLSTKALQISNKLNYPLTVMHAHFDTETTDRTPQSWSPLKNYKMPQIKPINVYNINSDLHKTKKSDSKDDQVNLYRSLPKKRGLLFSTRLFVVVGFLCFFFVAFWLHISLSKVEKLKNEAINLIKQKLPQPSTKNHILLPINMKLNRAGRFGGRKAMKVIDASGAESMCPIRSTKTDVQMLDTYDQLPFDNFDNHGPWPQGFDITYNQKQAKKEKTLEVVVIPHSHCDPGWLMTFEEYYKDKVENILNKMLKHLHHKKDMKFIYAEMSFFELWWSKLSESKKEQTKSFLRSGQLEIVTGGWVMTDEANTRSFSIVMELFEGHEFLRNQLEYIPKSHWAIDPFGLSATGGQFAKLTQMAVQRAHYEVKKHLARTKQLEFRWRQLYAGESANTDIKTHMFPFSSYIISRSCGPDPEICCQFDFGAEGCKWNTSDNIDYITEQNMEERAAMLYDQYRKKAQLYRMNTLLVPLGNDFRWDTSQDWNDQYTNYKQLFDYMNKKEEWNIKARFGTLKDYFDLLDKRLNEEPSNSLYKDLPTLSGDFFTYADFDDNYWSGYFTSRPFYKHMDRTVQHYVRSADILFALAMWKAKREHKIESPLSSKHYDMLVQSRRSLSLFQHHDGVTGTAKDHVVVDYGKNIFTDARTLTTNDIVSISNKHLTANFDSKTGYLKSAQNANEKATSVNMEFLYYLARKRKGKSLNQLTRFNRHTFQSTLPVQAAPLVRICFYLTVPATPMNTADNFFVVMKGDVRQTLLVKGPKDVSLLQQVHLDFNSNYLDIVNRGQDEQFYTDLNGFQMIRRMRFKKLPIQAHFFPMTTAAMVESSGQRLTLLGRQSLGVASLEAGQLEVILDRRLMQDDDRGLEQGVTDNHETESHFRLIVEKIRPQLDVNANRIGYLSTKALQISNKLNYPLTVMHAHFDTETTDRTPQSWSPLKKPFPCDTHLFAFRTLSEPTVYSEHGKRSTEPKFKASLDIGTARNRMLD
ncbi:Alpha-mannosidase [Aphelenchoides bicaudatus]|nr:Alpha-mannosidase [Aphelenchoides bicaudatus]